MRRHQTRFAGSENGTNGEIHFADWQYWLPRAAVCKLRTPTKSSCFFWKRSDLRIAPSSFYRIQKDGTGVIEGFVFRPAQARSKRSRFITLFQAATKSFTNFSFESSEA